MEPTGHAPEDLTENSPPTTNVNKPKKQINRKAREDTKCRKE